VIRGPARGEGRAGGISATVAIALLVVLAACGPTPTPAPSRPTAAATGSLAPAATAEGPSNPASSAAPPSASVPVGAVTQVDQGLLAFLPAEVDGVPLTFDPDTSATLAADTSVAVDAAAIAVGLAVVPGASASEDLAIVNVVRLRDPSHDDAWFRDWRDTYDQGACGQAGGVTGNAEATLGGAKVYIGSCAGGVLTYHTRIERVGLVVSVTALGSRRLGEKLMAGLQH
jgi:hypothetical protein